MEELLDLISLLQEVEEVVAAEGVVEAEVDLVVVEEVASVGVEEAEEEVLVVIEEEAVAVEEEVVATVADFLSQEWLSDKANPKCSDSVKGEYHNSFL